MYPLWWYYNTYTICSYNSRVFEIKNCIYRFINNSIPDNNERKNCIDVCKINSVIQNMIIIICYYRVIVCYVPSGYILESKGLSYSVATSSQVNFFYK